MSVNSEKRKIWHFPWGYAESFIIASALLFIGFILEFFSAGKITQLPPWPVNIILLSAFLVYLIITYFIVKGPIMQWLTSVPAAMSAMTTFTFLVLLMGFIPQGEPTGFAGKIGLHHVHNSKPYIIIAVFMLTILGFTIIKRLSHKLSLKNFAFLLNHLGLFIIITAASIGSSDLMRLKMHVKKGETTNIAFPDTRHKAEMPFSLQLNSFNIEEYPPELMIYDGKTGMPVSKKGKGFPFIEEGMKLKILDYNIDVISYLPYAVPVEGKYEPTEQFGSTHAVLIRTNDGTQDWISCGNFMYPPKYIQLNDKHIIGMAAPNVKRYVSDVNVIVNGKETTKNTEISVNKPLRQGQWKIYQFSYNSELGRWSEMSVFEIIRDPWLPAVYTGIFMVLLGSIYLLWTGRKL